MHRRTFVLFVVGLVLETAGFFGGHAEDIPLVTKVLVPREAGISEGVRHLETSPDLSPGQPGFDAISKLFLRLSRSKIGLHGISPDGEPSGYSLPSPLKRAERAVLRRLDYISPRIHSRAKRRGCEIWIY